ncbi:hypothetical protein [Streptomyces fradiae]|nr:hypothetical protein [Streptomyces fradiae]
MTSAYRVMTAWMAVTSVSKSSTNWLMETFMTDVSRTIRNWAVPRTARARQCFTRPPHRIGPERRWAARAAAGAGPPLRPAHPTRAARASPATGEGPRR